MRTTPTTPPTTPPTIAPVLREDPPELDSGNAEGDELEVRSVLDGVDVEAEEVVDAMNDVDDAVDEEVADGLWSVISPLFIQRPLFFTQQSVFLLPQQMLLSSHCVTSASDAFAGSPRESKEKSRFSQASLSLETQRLQS